MVRRVWKPDLFMSGIMPDLCKKGIEGRVLISDPPFITVERRKLSTWEGIPKPLYTEQKPNAISLSSPVAWITLF